MVTRFIRRWGFCFCGAAFLLHLYLPPLHHLEHTRRDDFHSPHCHHTYYQPETVHPAACSGDPDGLAAGRERTASECHICATLADFNIFPAQENFLFNPITRAAKLPVSSPTEPLITHLPLSSIRGPPALA